MFERAYLDATSHQQKNCIYLICIYRFFFFPLYTNKNMSTKENLMPLSEKRENVNDRLTYNIN